MLMKHRYPEQVELEHDEAANISRPESPSLGQIAHLLSF
jgi:hypothetical protein